MQYLFALAKDEDLAKIWSMIQDRIHWMDDHGIEQWNVTDYCEAYPLAYYEQAVQENALFAMKRKTDETVVAAAVLIEEDEQWDDRESAYYVHNLVTDLNEPGVGRMFLNECCNLAKSNRKKYLRLDCATSNAALNKYYDAQGFVLKGTFVDGPYVGNKREKIV